MSGLIFLRWKSVRLLKRILFSLRGNLSFRDGIPPDSALSVKANFMQKQITMQQTSHFISHHISKLNDFIKETFYDNKRMYVAHNSNSQKSITQKNVINLLTNQLTKITLRSLQKKLMRFMKENVCIC